MAKLTGRKLSDLLRASMKTVEDAHLPDLVAAYERSLNDAASRASGQFALTAAANWQPPAEGATLTVAQIAALAAALNTKLTPIWTRILLEVPEPVFARIAIAWDVKHPLAQALLAQAGKRTGARLGEASQFILRGTLGNAYEQGLDVRATSALIQSAMSEAAPWQADMLARTDLNSLGNGSSKAAAQATGMAYKTWISALLPTTRLTHGEAHGQTVPMNDVFVVGGEECDYPGDPALSDAESCNCVCSLGYGETLDEAGGLTADASIIPDAMATKTQRRRRYDRRAARAKPDALTAGAQGGTFSLGARDERWDANAAEGSYDLPTDSNCYMWRDSSKPADQRGSYKLPFVSKSGRKHAVWGAITAIAQRLGSTQIPDSDKAAIRRKLATYYSAARAKYNDDAIQVPFAAQTATSLAALPSGVKAMPTGVRACSMKGVPGYSGGGACHIHDGSEAGMKSALRKAQQDASKKNANSLLASARPIGFEGTAAIEGKLSDDNSIAPRVLLPDSLSWPEMPVSFLAQTVTAEGHDGAEVAGRVDEFARKKSTGKMRNIDFNGELTTPFGIDEIAPMIDDETMRYVSADVGASEWALVERDSLKPVPDEEFDLAKAQDGAYALGLTSGKIKGVTLVSGQAIEGAMVALVASADRDGICIFDASPEGDVRIIIPLQQFTLRGEALVASPAPRNPPRAWFETAEPPGVMPLTVMEDGRVYGHMATWESCHVGFLKGGQCVPPPKSASNYAYFHVCELDTAEGDTVTVGKLMFSPGNGGHADRGLTASKASAYYDQTGMAAAYLRVTDGVHGIWAVGSLNPDLSDTQRQEMRRQLRLHPPSGDWRPINGQYELICGLAVAVPGFPVPRAVLTMIGSGDGSEALIASSGWFAPDEAALTALEHLGLSDEDTEADRKMRALAARAEGLEALAALTEGNGHGTVAANDVGVVVLDESDLPPRSVTPKMTRPQDAALDNQISAALGTLAHVTEMATKLEHAEQRATEMAQMVEDAREEHRQETVAQKRDTLALVESMTSRIASAEKISEAMLTAMGQLTERKSRSVTVIRDADGRPASYEVA
jgi:hypothetical protein